jgi:hypothetical protein
MMPCYDPPDYERLAREEKAAILALKETING